MAAPGTNLPPFYKETVRVMPVPRQREPSRRSSVLRQATNPRMSDRHAFDHDPLINHKPPCHGSEKRRYRAPARGAPHRAHLTQTNSISERPRV